MCDEEVGCGLCDACAGRDRVTRPDAGTTPAFARVPDAFLAEGPEGRTRAGKEPPHEDIPGIIGCPTCRWDNPDTRTFCWTCGAPLRSAGLWNPLTWCRRLRARRPERPVIRQRGVLWYVLWTALPVASATALSIGWWWR
ncbi:hypothetical protein ACFP1Z_31375 [Streptomyces gamaensis]|uniref:RanBP2-type domain-containing protein n=1 Tax=Streptomyces gamaensis TaxID=1763542 RepID=A0ABW0Z9M4_9ACTN